MLEHMTIFIYVHDTMKTYQLAFLIGNIY
uniref:Uncharacterized protein n=1 Tax=Arundo donax TaxID=35708 RepID=A0A0A9C0Z1_ARUDO